MSVVEALAHGRARLGGDLRDARVLLAHAAGLERDTLHRLDDADLTTDLMSRYGALLARRAAGEPVSRILGHRDFWRHRFCITPDVLDPRPETEALVAAALEGPFSRVLDLGTGSGAILISLLAEREAASGVGTDISPSALDVARHNASTLGVADRGAFLCSDWFEGVTGCFDLIVSNPPYITEEEMSALSPEVARHDPHLALSPGGDGLDAYRAIAAGAAHHMTPSGRLVLEIGWRQGQTVAAILDAAGFSAVELRADFDGRDRVVLGGFG